MPARAALLALALAGCSSPSKSTGPQGQPPGACAAQVGAYRLRFVEGPGGACGQLTDQIVGANTEGGSTMGQIPANCTGSDTLSTNRCVETVQMRCRLDSGNTQTTAGALNYAADGSGASGVLQIEILAPDGRLLCGSVYEVTATKI